MWAAAENHASVVEALLDAGADPYVASNTYADDELRPVETATVPPQWISKGGLTALHFAARQGAKDVVRVMAEKGVDLERADPDGTTALIFAAFNGHFDTAALLLDKGANPNRSDSFGQTVLFLSVDLGIVEDDGATIGPRGAPPKTLDTNETSPLQLAKLAIARGANPNAQILKRLRRRAVYFGVPVDPVPEGATPLWRAARTFDIDFIKVLLAAGADPTIPASDGRTSLMAAAGLEMSTYYGDKYPAIGTEEQRVNTLRVLLDAGVDIHQGNIRNETPLHVAATTGQPSVVTLLVERGARLDRKDSDNRTPLDVALGIDRRPRGQLYSPVPVDERVVAVLREAMIAKGVPIEPWTPPPPSQGAAAR
jgi:ankyrin repeat protein